MYREKNYNKRKESAQRYLATAAKRYENGNAA
jgi:hypothetical protein